MSARGRGGTGGSMLSGARLGTEFIRVTGGTPSGRARPRDPTESPMATVAVTAAVDASLFCPGDRTASTVSLPLESGVPVRCAETQRCCPCFAARLSQDFGVVVDLVRAVVEGGSEASSSPMSARAQSFIILSSRATSAPPKGRLSAGLGSPLYAFKF